MSKQIETLVEDIFNVIDTRGGWDATITEFISSEMGATFKARLEDEAEERAGALRMSAMGRPCKRQLWYQHNNPSSGESLAPQTLLKFLYGDMVETLILSLALASGHEVRGMQDTLSIRGIEGHRDVVIDGVTVDVKSASDFAFNKFRDGLTPDGDGFGYLGQLRAYIAAGAAADPTISPSRGAFLVVNKVTGAVTLDVHEFPTLTLEQMEEEYDKTIALAEADNPPPRGIEDVADGYYKGRGATRTFVPNGNKVLAFNCAYCEFKKECWPGLRTFMYKGQSGPKPKFYTVVKKEPTVMEVTDV